MCPPIHFIVHLKEKRANSKFMYELATGKTRGQEIKH
jgi:hypothetical protein